ncbi:MAG TPA: ZIP family metal transporter [archaeon]|nr:ZIP family metal transporter [archaeon]
MVYEYVFGSILLVSLISLIGLFTLGLKEKFLKRILLLLVSFAAGALFGDAFIHLIPESIESIGEPLPVSLMVLSGIIVFFILENVIHWHHAHHIEEKHAHPFTYLNLIGDAFHNFIDGALIAASFLASIQVGIATTIAVILHEIPQEIGDFAVLIQGGFTKNKALKFNFLTALTAFLGAGITLLISSSFENLEQILLPFTAGGFIYIAGSDLIPELHRESRLKKRLIDTVAQLLAFITGIGLMLALLLIEI